MSDFLVLGGGIAGLSAAARLSAHASVTLLEREPVTGYHASGRSAALIEENYGAPSVQALNRASMAYLKYHNDGVLSPRGLLILGQQGEGDAFEKDAAAMGVTPISTGDALAMVPILDAAKLAYAGYHAEAFDIDTDQLMQDFSRSLRKNGGDVICNADVQEITKTSEGWRVTAGGEIYNAERLMNAGGAWADQLAEMAGIAPLGIQPYRRSMARIAMPDVGDLSRWPMFFGVNESWYAKPDAGALLVSPADEDPMPPQDAWADDMVLAQGLALYENMVTVPVLRLLASWAGLRSFAPDRTLVLGPDPSDDSFIWSAGQGGYGMQTAPAASQLVSDLAFGHPCELEADVIAALTPARLRA